MYQNNLFNRNLNDPIPTSSATYGGGPCTNYLRGSNMCNNGECVNGKCVCTESTCQDPYCDCPSTIPGELQEELKNFLPIFLEKFKYTFASNLKDIILCQDKTYFRQFFNFFLNAVSLDWGSAIVNFLTIWLSKGFVGNPNYYINDIKNWESISFNYLNDDIKYSCIDGKSYITLNLGLTNFTTDKDGNDTIFTIAMTINTFVYMTLIPWSIDFNPKMENLPVKLTIEVLKNTETGNMSFNLNNFHLDLDFGALMQPMLLWTLFLNFSKFFSQYRVSTMPNGFLKGFLPGFFKGEKLPGAAKEVIKSGYQGVKNLVEEQQRDRATTGNVQEGIELTKLSDDLYTAFFTPFSSPQKIDPRKSKRILEIINQSLEKFDKKEDFIFRRTNLEGIKTFVKNFTNYLLNTSLADVLSFLYTYKSAPGGLFKDKIIEVASYEITFFIILVINLFVIYMITFSMGLKYKSTFKKSNILNTNFKCTECTYDDTARFPSCQKATYSPPPVTESPCPPCKDECYDLKTSDLPKKIDQLNTLLYNNNSRRLLAKDNSCIPNCQNKLSCFDDDGCGNFCGEKYINIDYTPLVTWNIMNLTNGNIISKYTLNKNSLQQDYLILINSNDTTKSIQIDYYSDEDQFGVILGDGFINKGEVFYYDISINMYKNLKNDLVIFPSNCDDKCYLFQNDNQNCGTCGNKCTGCLKCCAGQCIDYNTDNNNCGGCGNKCPENTYCCDGQCLPNRGSDCKCLPGWSGDNCDISTPTCNNRGLLENNKCVCDFPWQGDNCQICPSNYKDCNTRECAYCYTGPNCEYSINDCSGNGCPIYGEYGLSCECTYPWQGDNCQTCPSNFKDCNTMECAACTAGKYCQYNTEYCNFNGCPVYDNVKGTISCQCNTGYSGTYCDKEL